MSKRPWMPIYWADYRMDTSHLTMPQHGAYLLLIGQHWVRGFLPGNIDDCARICRTDTDDERQDVAKVLAEFFELVNGRYVNKRVLEEIAKVDVICAKRSAAADKRWKKGSNVVDLKGKTKKEPTTDDDTF